MVARFESRCEVLLTQGWQVAKHRVIYGAGRLFAAQKTNIRIHRFTENKRKHVPETICDAENDLPSTSHSASQLLQMDPASSKNPCRMRHLRVNVTLMHV